MFLKNQGKELFEKTHYLSEIYTLFFLSPRFEGLLVHPPMVTFLITYTCIIHTESVNKPFYWHVLNLSNRLEQRFINVHGTYGVFNKKLTSVIIILNTSYKDFSAFTFVHAMTPFSVLD